jgi:hypothetical protein
MYGHVNYLNKNYLNQGEPKQTIITSCNLVSYGGFVSHGGTPKSSKSLDQFSIESYDYDHLVIRIFNIAMEHWLTLPIYFDDLPISTVINQHNYHVTYEKHGDVPYIPI